ncbi:MAG: hypothetical protein ACR2HY_05490, partial [Acidimicrobiales bacterium]
MRAPTLAPPTIRVPIDPRIRRRQLQVRRAEGRRRLRLLVATSIVVAVLGAGWGLTRSPLLDVDRVTVQGAVGPRGRQRHTNNKIRPKEDT